jgi:hypothetical protein
MSLQSSNLKTDSLPRIYIKARNKISEPGGIFQKG